VVILLEMAFYLDLVAWLRCVLEQYDGRSAGLVCGAPPGKKRRDRVPADYLPYIGTTRRLKKIRSSY
tara:strand:- start:79 stop:279 length:201 start_codon:yes stop_codon:yes gene_type:complete